MPVSSTYAILLIIVLLREATRKYRCRIETPEDSTGVQTRRDRHSLSKGAEVLVGRDAFEVAVEAYQLGRRGNILVYQLALHNKRAK